MIKESDALFSIYSPARTQSRENKGLLNVTVYVHMLYTMYWWVMMMMMKKSLFTKAHVCCEIMYVMPTRFLLYHDTLLYDFYCHFDTCGARAVFFSLSLSLCARWHRCAIPISDTRTTTRIPENAAQLTLILTRAETTEKGLTYGRSLRQQKKK